VIVEDKLYNDLYKLVCELCYFR